MQFSGTGSRVGSIVGSFATPLVVMRREYATPTWRPEGQLMDQEYYRRVFEANGWSQELRHSGDVVIVKDVLCLIHTDPAGGMRGGRY